jgi:hypothetical protein
VRERKRERERERERERGREIKRERSRVCDDLSTFNIVLWRLCHGCQVVLLQT